MAHDHLDWSRLDSRATNGMEMVPAALCVSRVCVCLLDACCREAVRKEWCEGGLSLDSAVRPMESLFESVCEFACASLRCGFPSQASTVEQQRHQGRAVL